MSQTEKKLELNGRTFILVGTAHISKESVEEVSAAVENEKPDCVAIELDEQRLKSMQDNESWKKMDIVTVLKKHQGFVLLANLVLASFQKKMGANVGVKPGDEMRAAIEKANNLNIPTAMVDRPVRTTLKRAWAKNSFWGKCKLLSVMVASIFDTSEVSSSEIENLKNTSEMDNMMKEISDFLPAVKEVLIDERDKYLASHIWNCKGDKVLAVLGAGHLGGVVAHLEALAAGKEDSDTSEIEKIPEKTLFGKMANWIIPVLIVALIAVGFYLGGRAKGFNMIGSWFIWNGVLAAIGTLIAAGHPLAILSSLVLAPFTSLCPFVGVGMVSGIVQAVVCKPTVSDLETMQQDFNLKGMYRNRVLRVFLVLILASIGSSVGTLVAGSSFVGNIVILLKNLFQK
ncbi:MAG: TraB/GumN family protein [Treponema sp.]|nr:TraB/GumN family protein [Treponema sp.]